LTATEASRAILHVSVYSYSNVYVHLNNGTSLKTAEDPIQVNSFNTGMDFYYTAQSNLIYLIFVASGANPSVNVSLSVTYLTDRAF
jgi:hypothetical protein